MKQLLTKILMVGIFGSLMIAQSDESGVISSNTTWSSNVNITGNILVSSSVTLTILPGVRVAFQGAYYLQSEGNLVADGNANSRITFTNSTQTPAGGYWQHIYIKNSGGGSISYCDFQYGGADGYIIKLENNSALSIKHNTFDEYGSNGSMIPGGTLIYSQNPSTSALIIIEYNLFTMHSTYSDMMNTWGGWTAISGSDMTVVKNIFIKGNNLSEPTGLSLRSSTITNNVFFNIDYPINCRYPSGSGGESTVSNNIIINADEKAISITGSPTITYNTIVSSELAISIPNESTAFSYSPVINYNNIYDNTKNVDVSVTRTEQPDPINGENNYWGTTNTSEIAALITDYNDDFNITEIDYDPYLTSPNTTAPISPPRNVTVSNASGNYILSWTGSPESDISGYKVYYGGYTGYSFSNVITFGMVAQYDMTAAGLESYLDSVIAVTAYDNNADGTDDQVEGYESWFSILPYTGPVWYVSKTGGSDDNDGSEDSPFITIQKGIDSALSGDTIRVGANNIIYSAPNSSQYYTNIIITDKSLTIISDSGADSTIIGGNNSNAPIWISGEASNVRLIGLSLTEGAPNSENTMGGGLSISSADSVFVKDMKIYGNSGEYGGGISAGNTDFIHINSSNIYNNSASSGGGIMLWDGGGKAEIVNTIIANNTVQVDGGGIVIQIDTTIILNTIIVNNQIPSGRYGPGLNLNMAINDSVLLMNSIITGNKREGETLSHQEFIHGGQLKSYNSIIGSDWTSPQPHTDENNLIYTQGIDPFVNSTSCNDSVMPYPPPCDYSLINSSSAIGSGLSSVEFSGMTITAPSTDYIGAARPQPAGTNPDMGAIENSLGVSAAKTIYVCPNTGMPECYNSDFEFIQSAIDAANDGDTILVYKYGVFFEHLAVYNKNLTIKANTTQYGETYATIDGQGTGRPITITGTSAVTLKGLSLKNGKDNVSSNSDGGGGIKVSSSGSVLLEYLDINNNQSDGNGGGVFVEANSIVTISSCKVRNNSAANDGGGLWIKSDDVIIQNTLVYGNSAQAAGGIFVSHDAGGMKLINSTITGNSGSSGAAIFIEIPDSILLVNNIFYNNGDDGLLLSDYPQPISGKIVAFNNYFSEVDGSGSLFISRGSNNIFSNSDPFGILWDTAVMEHDSIYTLVDYSSAIGSGIDTVTFNGSTYIAPLTDYNGDVRPQPAGSNPDMGAIENTLGVAIAMPAIVVCGDSADPVCMDLNNPYHNIQSAINASEHGDTILVYPGTYYENINLNGKNIVVGSLYLTMHDTSYITSTVIDAMAAGSVVHISENTTNDVKLIGLTLTGGYSSEGAGIYAPNANLTLDHLIVKNCYATGDIDGGGGYLGGNVTITNCTFQNNTGRKGGALALNNGNFLVENCRLINNNGWETGGALHMGGNVTIKNTLIVGNNGGPPIYCSNCGADIINSTIAGNSNESPANDSLNYIVFMVSGSINFKNSILYNHGFQEVGSFVGPNPGSVTISYSNIRGGYSGEGNISTDPLFVNPDSGNYNLQLGSPCIDSGDPDLDGDGITWETDTDDQDQDGTRMDMGFAPTSCLVDQCGICDYDTSNDCVQDCAGAWGDDAELDCLGICEGGAILDDCGDCNGENENMNECGVCDALYSCNPFVLSNEKDTISLKVDTLRFTFSVPMDTLRFSAISLTSTEIDNIEFHTSQEADSIRTLTLLIDSPLVSRDTLALTFPSTLESSFGYPFDGNQDGTTGDGQTITLYTETLADYNHDNAIDFDDMTTFIASWYADDYDKELGPVTGTVPHLIPTFDNAFDIEDIITFMLMWNWANDFTPTPAGRIKDSGIPPNIVLQDGILQLDLSEYLENIAAVRIQLSTSDPQVKVVSEGIQSPFDITLLRSWEEDNIYEWNLGNPQGKHFNVVQLCHLETMQKQNLHLVIDYEIISIHGNILSSGRTALDHIVIPNEYALQQAYPNPFNPVTNLKFGLPVDSKVSIQIYNLQGQVVSTLLNDNMQAGYHSVVWNADEFGSGIYFVQMIARDYIHTQKLMLVK